MEIAEYSLSRNLCYLLMRISIQCICLSHHSIRAHTQSTECIDIVEEVFGDDGDKDEESEADKEGEAEKDEGKGEKAEATRSCLHEKIDSADEAQRCWLYLVFGHYHQGAGSCRWSKASTNIEFLLFFCEEGCISIYVLFFLLLSCFLQDKMINNSIM